jgi:hypothetical protein
VTAIFALDLLFFHRGLNLQEETLQAARRAERHSKWFVFSIY